MARPYRIVLFAIAAVGAVVLVALVAKPLIILFAGLLFALVLSRVADALARASKMPYGVCLGGIVVALLSLTVVAAVVIGPSLGEQVSDLVTRVPAAVHDIRRHVRDQHLKEAITPAPTTGSQGAKAIATGAVVAVGTTVEIVAGLVVIFFVGVYGAARPRDYAKAVLSVTPERHRERVRATMGEAFGNLTRWILGRLVAMLFVGITCAIAFTLLRVPLALTLAIFAGLLTFVEYVGAVISAVPPILLAFTKSPGTALAVLLVYTVLHVVEGYVLTPLLVRASVRFPPALTLAGQVVFAALVGPLGLTFSTPLLVVGVAAFRSWHHAESSHEADEQLEIRGAKTIGRPSEQTA